MFNYYIKIYGCLYNYSDADKIRSILNRSGNLETKRLSDADVVIIISCSIREKAEHRVFDFQFKVKNDPSLKSPFVILTGCMARRSYISSEEESNLEYLKRLRRRAKFVDLILDIKDISKIPELIKSSKKICFTSGARIKLNQTKDSSSIISNIPIMNGCNEFCTYCIVPYTRGKEEYRSLKSIILDIKREVDRGCRIVNLLGHVVNKWMHRKYKFIDLLESIENIDREFRFTFISPHPKYIDRRVIDFMATSRKSLRYLGLPVQSGSDRILKLMNRKYTIDYYSEITEYAIRKIPNLYLTTDIIVGYPSETDSDFEQTLSLIKRFNFDKVFLAKFSPRLDKPEEKALVKKPEYFSVIKYRFNKLNLLCKSIELSRNNQQVGKELAGYILDKSVAISERNQLINLSCDTKSCVGDKVRLRIKDSSNKGLIGEIV